jgi:hypothetical protein
MQGSTKYAFLSCLAAALLSAAMPAAAQTVFSDSFEGGVTAWLLSPPMGGVGWAVDNTPGPPFGPSPAPGGGLDSMNYNNGTNYNSGGTNQGTATSPLINLAGVATPITFTLYDWYYLENDANPGNVNFYDRRLVQILDSASQVLTTYHCQDSNGTDPGLYPNVEVCSAFAGAWHTHTIDLSTYVGQTIRLRFFFNTVDAILNNQSGWFLDLVRVEGGGGPGPGVGAGVGPGAGAGYQGPGYNPGGVFVNAPDQSGNGGGGEGSDRDFCIFGTAAVPGEKHRLFAWTLGLTGVILLLAAAFGRRRAVVRAG